MNALISLLADVVLGTAVWVVFVTIFLYPTKRDTSTKSPDTRPLARRTKEPAP